MIERLRGYFLILCVLVKGLLCIYISIPIGQKCHLDDFVTQPAPLI